MAIAIPPVYRHNLIKACWIENRVSNLKPYCPCLSILLYIGYMAKAMGRAEKGLLVTIQELYLCLVYECYILAVSSAAAAANFARWEISVFKFDSVTMEELGSGAKWTAEAIAIIALFIIVHSRLFNLFDHPYTDPVCSCNLILY